MGPSAGPSTLVTNEHMIFIQDFEKLLKSVGPPGWPAGPRCGHHGKEGRAGPEHGPPWRKAKFMQGEMEGFKEESGQDVLR